MGNPLKWLVKLAVLGMGVLLGTAHADQITRNANADISWMVQYLRRLPPNKRTISPQLNAVSRSHQREAVDFMLEVLCDPQAAPEWRRQAFLHLADTGGAKGVSAVRQARPKAGPRKPWWERVDVDHLDPNARLAIGQDNKGRTWMLFHHQVLGNAGDLFIVQKAGQNWGRPLFTGARTDETSNQSALTTFRGSPMAKLRSSGWLRLFPDDTVIRRDTDHDGLTDLVEARLGTDARKRDTDGDTLSDSVDACPNAAPRRLSNDEKIFAACIEARFFLVDWGVPAELTVDRVKPFELYGYPSTLIWSNSTHTGPLASASDGEAAFLSFSNPNVKSGREKPVIEYDFSGTTARTLIHLVSGGLGGDRNEVKLRKIGAEWFVVDWVVRRVS